MKQVSVVAIAAALCAAVAAGSAQGAGTLGASPGFSICEPVAGVSLLAGESLAARGGGGPREPNLSQPHDDLPASAKGRAASDFAVTVPVYFHVVTDGALGNLRDSQIADQIRVLNNTFAGGEGGFDTGFSFVLAGVTRTNNPAWFYTNPGGADENTMKQTLRRGGPDALNFYSTTAGAFLGWAYFPEIVTKPGQIHRDGVVVDWESLRRVSDTYAGRYDQGETGTHEVGHWLNLDHTFNGGCSAKGDFVDDTPPEKTPTSGCPAGKDTCSAPGLDPIHNYMDYSFDQCYTEFTAGQAQRMRDAWLLYRAPR
jgi:pregnancy-associated plasma protein-A